MRSSMEDDDHDLDTNTRPPAPSLNNGVGGGVQEASTGSSVRSFSVTPEFNMIQASQAGQRKSPASVVAIQEEPRSPIKKSSRSDERKYVAVSAGSPVAIEMSTKKAPASPRVLVVVKENPSNDLHPSASLKTRLSGDEKSEWFASDEEENAFIKETRFATNSWIKFLRRFTFFQIHLTYFLTFGLLFGTIIFLLEIGTTDVSYLDAVFTAVSSMTCSIALIDVSQVRFVTQVALWFAMNFGSGVFLTLPPLLFRIASHAETIREHMHTDINKNRIRVNILKLRAMRRLSLIVVLYFIGVQLSGMLLLFMYLELNQTAKDIMISNGVTSVSWFAIFHVVSAFNNMGLGLFASNLVPYAGDFFVLFVMGSQILFGNNLYPVALRFIVSTLKSVTKSDVARQEYSFLLLNSRECFTNLFPAINTQILFMIVMAFNVFQWISYLVLDWNSGLFGALTPWQRVFSALFQSISTRAAGFNVYDLSKRQIL
eukprot:TRINITY_DN2928_c0_g1_i1.p1 TRINITY_DN2928_c0_g1~~TRINITY_DN2928_c0_g1_i1.p1  ORF type:complete len:485 (+),score=105.04 TRINITY_DN2928_c0_g1_i1:40-1494(+)